MNKYKKVSPYLFIDYYFLIKQTLSDIANKLTNNIDIKNVR